MDSTTRPPRPATAPAASAAVATSTSLAAGEARLLHMRAGTGLHLSRGQLQVIAPLPWPGDTAPPPPLLLRAGERHSAEHTGWYRLEAMAAQSTLSVHAPPPAPRLSAWLPRALHGLSALAARSGARGRGATHLLQTTD